MSSGEKPAARSEATSFCGNLGGYRPKRPTLARPTTCKLCSQIRYKGNVALISRAASSHAACIDDVQPEEDMPPLRGRKR